MKKLIFSFAFLAMGFSAIAQSDQYKAGMTALTKRMTMAEQSPDAYRDLSNAFARIADAEKAEWLPKYYVAFNLIMQAMLTKEKENVDGILDQADKVLSEISITTKSDEVMCLQSWSKSTRIGVDPMTRGMKFGAESAKFLGQAQALNADNPRIYFLQAQSAFYTPEAFGGGKKKAKELFTKALEKYQAFKSSGEFMPTWGMEDTQRMLLECDK